MKSRALPILNAFGCLALSGVIVVQWQRERMLDETLAKLKYELRTANDQAAAEATRAANLERDIAVLKESIEATQQAAGESAREQGAIWQTSLAERDEKLRELDAELTTTRQRLDEAVARLKEAGAR